MHRGCGRVVLYRDGVGELQRLDNLFLDLALSKGGWEGH